MYKRYPHLLVSASLSLSLQLLTQVIFLWSVNRNLTKNPGPYVELKVRNRLELAFVEQNRKKLKSVIYYYKTHIVYNIYIFIC